jgi:hypothetical protein
VAARLGTDWGGLHFPLRFTFGTVLREQALRFGKLAASTLSHSRSTMVAVRSMARSAGITARCPRCQGRPSPLSQRPALPRGLLLLKRLPSPAVDVIELVVDHSPDSFEFWALGLRAAAGEAPQ